MELFFLCGLILFTLFVAVSLRCLFPNNSKSSYSNLPPGNLGFPFVGESLEFLSVGRKGHPEKFIFDRIAKYSSQIFKTSIFAEPTIVVCGAALNKFLFSNENKLVTAWWPESINKIFPSTAQTSTKEVSKNLRTMLPNFLKPAALMRYVETMDSSAQRHFAAEWEGKEQVTVFPVARRYTFSVALKVFLSIDDAKHVAKLADPFNALASGIFSLPIDLPGTSFNYAIKASSFIRKELAAIIRQRKIDLEQNKTSPNDVLSHMLQATGENGQHMIELEMADKIIGLLFGGYDTASTVITGIIKYLSELPHIYNQVLEEQMEIAKSKKPGELLNWEDIQKMKYSWNVACEVLRLCPPLQGSFREAINDFSLNGFSIPKGWKLYWNAYSTHKNAECFPEPEKFDPTRFEGNGPAPYTFVPFGGGPKMCPGKEYARLEILVFMHNAVKRFNWEKLIPNEKVIVNPLTMPAKGLPIRLIPHRHLHK